MNAITLKNVTKSYLLNASGAQLLKYALNPQTAKHEHVALNDVSFELARGQTLGVLGVNGAGKSTLLKLLAGVCAPTSGTVEVCGKISALLELGAGFNPEYTGIENAKTSLLLSGLKGDAAKNALEDAINFADIGNFVHSPVKTYSSGMFVRLAFACATAVCPDILLVDEALSVGDLFFQAKCIKRMKAMLNSGVTLVFVSHDIGAVKELCSTCLLLNGGNAHSFGDTEQVARSYFSLKLDSNEPALKNTHTAKICRSNSEFLLRTKDSLGSKDVYFTNASLQDSAGEIIQSGYFGQKASLVLQLECTKDTPLICVGYHVQSHSGVDVFYTDTAIEQCNIKDLKALQTCSVTFNFELNLAEGSHNIAIVCSIPKDMAVGDVEFLHYVHTATQFSMQRRQLAKLYSLAYTKNEVTIEQARNFSNNERV